MCVIVRVSVYKDDLVHSLEPCCSRALFSFFKSQTEERQMDVCFLKGKMDASAGKRRSLREGIQLGRIQRKLLEGANMSKLS